MTMMGLDTETIEHLDFEFSESCENQKEPCDRTAEWFWILGCCGTMILLCEVCHKVLLEFRTENPDMVIRCTPCGNVGRCDKWLMQFGKI